MMDDNSKEIEIYQSQDGKINVEVGFDSETVWISLNELAKLFGRDKSVISRHLKNIYENEELDFNETVREYRQTKIEEKPTVAKNATVRNTKSSGRISKLSGRISKSDFYRSGKLISTRNPNKISKLGYYRIAPAPHQRMVTRTIRIYNLDAIIAVGYRVNSKEGTMFRKWATGLLQKHLVEGYTINERRLDQLQRLFSIIDESRNLNAEESKEILDIIRHYTQSFTLLNQYDTQSFRLEHLQKNIDYAIEYDDIAIEIAKLKEDLMQKEEASDLFGRENDNAFKAITGNINQSFDGKLLYPNIEEQAANLLYLIIKDHPFIDGNKRIASFTFVWFLQKNNYHLKAGKVLKISNNALVALTLLIVNSNAQDKKLMIDLIVNLIGNDHEQ